MPGVCVCVCVVVTVETQTLTEGEGEMRAVWQRYTSALSVPQ